MSDLDSIAEQFQLVDATERLELLIDFGRRLPHLPADYGSLRDAGLNMIHECQAPVFLVVAIKEGIIKIHADVPAEAPIARGFVSLLTCVFDGKRPSEVTAAPGEILALLGLTGLLGMQRTRGLHAIYQRVRSEVSRIVE